MREPRQGEIEAAFVASSKEDRLHVWRRVSHLRSRRLTEKGVDGIT